MPELNERRRILDMLAAGQIGPDEADALLEAMEADRGQDNEDNDLADEIKQAVKAQLGGIGLGKDFDFRRRGKHHPHRRISRSLRIEITSGDEARNKNGRVVVTVPLTLAKFAGKLLPEGARARLEDNGIELNELLEQLDQDLPEGRLIDIDTGDPESETGRSRIVVEVV